MSAQSLLDPVTAGRARGKPSQIREHCVLRMHLSLSRATYYIRLHSMLVATRE